MAHDDEILRRSFDSYLPRAAERWSFTASPQFWQNVRSIKGPRQLLWPAAVAAAASLAIVVPALSGLNHQAASRDSGIASLPPLLDMQMTSPNSGWAESLQGRLYVTRTAGRTWSKTSVIDMHGVAASSPSTLWVLGQAEKPGTRYTVWLTTNMGQTWQRTTIALPWIPNLISIQAYNAHAAWVLDDRTGPHRQLSEAIEGVRAAGARLQQVRILTVTHVPTGQPMLVGASPTSLKRGWAVSSTNGSRPVPGVPTVFRVVPGRITASSLPLPSHMGPTGPATPSAIPYGGVQTPTPGVSYLVATSQSSADATSGKTLWMVYRNAGNGWRVIWRGPRGSYVVSTDFLNRRVGWIVVGRGSHRALTLLYTINGGRTFERASAPSKTVDSFGFLSSDTGWWTAGTPPHGGKMWVTTDGGRSWHQARN